MTSHTLRHPPAAHACTAVCLAIALSLVTAGCSTDLKKTADEHVADDLLADHQQQEAISFFENEGRFYDVDDSTNVDQEIVLPLLKDLRAVVATDQSVVLKPDEENAAFALLVKLPGDEPTVDRMAAAVQAADDKFPGLILQQWGHEWLLMNLIDQETYEHLKQVDPDIDKQR